MFSDANVVRYMLRELQPYLGCFLLCCKSIRRFTDYQMLNVIPASQLRDSYSNLRLWFWKCARKCERINQLVNILHSESKCELLLIICKDKVFCNLLKMKYLDGMFRFKLWKIMKRITNDSVFFIILLAFTKFVA